MTSVSPRPASPIGERAFLAIGAFISLCLLGVAVAYPIVRGAAVDPRARLVEALRMAAHLTIMCAVFLWGRRRGRSAVWSTAAGAACSLLSSVPIDLGCAELLWGATAHVAVDASFALRSILQAPKRVILWLVAFMLPFMGLRARARAEEARAAAREVELLRLRTTLEPHFLLNALNAISTCVAEDPVEARRLLAKLGELLEAMFEGDAERATPAVHALADEIRWLESYASLLEARYRERLAFTWWIDAQARACSIPRWILQPLVENAVEHGALAKDGGGSVEVHAKIVSPAPRAAALELLIVDDGPGLSPGPVEQGRGLDIVRRRLAVASPRGTLELSSRDGRTVARIELPLEAARAG
jgi:hypothetical protein